MNKAVELNKEKFFSPEEVRKILNSDNQEIKRLCKQVCISPKRDTTTGKTFFLRNDVEILKKIKDLHEKGQKVIQKNQAASTALVSQNLNAESANIENKEINLLVKTIISSQDTLVDKLSKAIDEKLDGIDDVVVELIKCKAENEKLKQKINQLTKDNYKLESELRSYKPLQFGLYIKNKNDQLYPSNFLN